MTRLELHNECGQPWHLCTCCGVCDFPPYLCECDDIPEDQA